MPVSIGIGMYAQKFNENQSGELCYVEQPVFSTDMCDRSSMRNVNRSENGHDLLRE